MGWNPNHKSAAKYARKKADELEQRVDEAIAAGTQDLEVKDARGGHVNLKSRLDETTTLLAQKANKGDSILVSQIDKNQGKLDQTYMTDEFLQQITGATPVNSVPANFSITREKLALEAVHPENLSFLKIGKNKTFKNPISGVIIDGTNFSVTAGTGSSFSHVAILEPNKTYTVKKYVGGNRFRIATVNEYPDKTKLPLGKVYSYEGLSSSEEQTHTFTNTTAKYMVIFTNSGTTNIPIVQVEEGSVPTEYQDFNWDLNIYDKGLPIPEKISDFFSVGKNKFNDQFIEGLTVHATFTRVDAATGSTKSLVVPIERGKEYTVTKFKGGNRFRLVLVDEYPSTDKLPLSGYYKHILPDNVDSETSVTFTNTGGKNKINYLVLQTNSALADTPLVQVEEGNAPTSYESYQLKYLGTTIALEQNIEAKKDKKYYFLDSIEGIYESPNLPAVSTGSEFVLRRSVHTDIYSIFDQLVADNPEYITKVSLGNEPTGKPIYRYNFVPVSPTGDLTLERPKIIIISGIHGDEKSAVWGLTQFLKDMCENWKSDKLLEFIRWNFEFIVVPISNPYGYDTNGRTNANSIDINRNYPTSKFVPNYELSGEVANSEIETQSIVNLINENLDADYFIDYHTFKTSGEGNLGWSQSRVPENKLLFMNVFSTLTRKWKKQYPQLPQDDKTLGYVTTTNTSTGTLYAHEKGVWSMTVESTELFGYGNTIEHDANNVNCSVEIIGNVIAGIGKNL